MIELIHGDCMDYMATLEDNAFDLAITDPPYGININHSIGRRKGMKPSNHKKTYWDNKTPNEGYFNELKRVSFNQIIWGGNYFANMLNNSPCWLMWDKGFSEDVTFAQFELAWTSFSSSCKKYDFNGQANRNKIHPTQKPVKLYEWLLKNYAKEGDRILDTHLGSGSSVIAAHNYNYDFVGIELDKDYFDAANKRFNQHKAQQTLF